VRVNQRAKAKQAQEISVLSFLGFEKWMARNHL
jgi:hypothetical protein